MLIIMVEIEMKEVNVFVPAFKAELRSIMGDSGAMLLIIFAILIYTFVYSVAYGREVVEDVVIGVVDGDNTPSSRRLIDGIRSGPNTKVGYEPISIIDAEELFYSRDIYGVVYIPSGYERRLLVGQSADVAVVLDGSHLLLYRQVLQQTVSDFLTLGAEIEAQRLVARGSDSATIRGIVEPVIYDSHTLYNPVLGYGSFVMPSIMVVIIQQTLIIGIALIAVRRRQEGFHCGSMTTYKALNVVCAKILVYMLLYGINLTIILGVVWSVFGFPYAGSTWSVALLMALYIVAVVSLALLLSRLFARRESPLMVLLWSSVPILLLAGLSYPKEAFPSWLYAVGELFPSSSAVRAFVGIGTMGASLGDVRRELFTLGVVAIVYFVLAVISEKYAGVNKKLIK